LSTLIAPTGIVVAAFTLSVTGVDTTTDDLQLIGYLWVSNQLGTEVITVAGTGDIAQVGPDQSGSIDWTMADATAVAGSDLTWDSTDVEVTSTAGGIFTVSLVWSATWD
jgi:hypothetical protein